MVNYYTSDLHFNDKNIIKSGLRKFSNIKEMNYSIIKSFTLVTPQDNLFILGDLFLGFRSALMETKRLLAKIPTKNIFVICGNHDSIEFLDNLKEEGIIKNWYRWKVIKDTIKGKHCNIALFHHPTIDYHNSLNPTMCFHGHSHGMMVFKLPDLFDVGWDRWHKPVTAEEIVTYQYSNTVSIV